MSDNPENQVEKTYTSNGYLTDIRSFYSGEPRMNRHSRVTETKNAWSRWHSHFGVPQAPSDKAQPCHAGIAWRNGHVGKAIKLITLI